MRLLEAIIKANKEAIAPVKSLQIDAQQYRDSMPVVALTCIDPRLNKLFPEVLGIPEDQFIWLRNAGNIITGPFSSTTRSIALACAVKGGKEILIIGHTDCAVGKTTVLSLTEKFKLLGVDRVKLPDNIVEFFGLFASERQNVINATQYIRQSPLISPSIPVHGVIVDTNNGKIEWLVNGYETLGASTTQFTSALEAAASKVEAAADMIKDFQVGTARVADTKIGEAISKVAELAQQVKQAAEEHPEAKSPAELAEKVIIDYTKHIFYNKLYKIIGGDSRVYGPVAGTIIIQWLNEGRINEHTPIQAEGSEIWTTIGDLANISKNIPESSKTSNSVRKFMIK